MDLWKEIQLVHRHILYGRNNKKPRGHRLSRFFIEKVNGNVVG